jgi:DNA repair ATPase RecN
MRLNIDDVEQKIKKAKQELRTYKEDSEEAKVLRLNISEYKRDLTEAKRELTNYRNT